MKEKQSFHAFITALVVFIAVFINFFLVYMTSLDPWIVFGIMLFNSLAALAFLIAKLETVYDNEKITIRFFPFILKRKEINWDEVDQAFIRKYSALREFGGWGIRFSLRKYGRAYNTQGDIGLQLVMKNGKKVLIGTQKAGELQSFLNKLYSQNIVKAEHE